MIFVGQKIGPAAAAAVVAAAAAAAAYDTNVGMTHTKTQCILVTI